jgi:hypothetical protein
MPRHRNLERDVAGVELFVRLVDPATGASAFVAIEPAIKPSSPLRFARERPPTPTRGVPLHRSPISTNAAERGK